MQLRGHDLAVCSWSLQPAGMSDLLSKVRKLGLEQMQLALGPLLVLDQKQRLQELAALRSSGIALTGGMIAFAGEDYSTIESIKQTGGFVPDDMWPAHRALIEQAAHLGAQLRIEAITTHVGFVPPPDDSRYLTIRNRVADAAAVFGESGIALLMETGQEPAAELLEFLQDLPTPNVYINFDPANMIMYGAGEPIAALKTLGKHVRHVHVKDAIAAARPGVDWGEEVPFGTGQVGPAAFLRVLDEIGYAGPLAIERESGSHRMEDVEGAIAALLGS